MYHGKVLESHDPISNIPEMLLNPKHDILGKNLKKFAVQLLKLLIKNYEKAENKFILHEWKEK